MTASEVEGRKVIADEPAETLLSTSERPMYFRQIRRLLLDDGSEVFGCLHCEFTAQTTNRVRPHLNKHRSQPRTTRGLTVEELLERIEQMHKLADDRDAWKARALKAEKSLATLRHALNP